MRVKLSSGFVAKTSANILSLEVFSYIWFIHVSTYYVVLTGVNWKYTLSKLKCLGQQIGAVVLQYCSIMICKVMVLGTAHLSGITFKNLIPVDVKLVAVYETNKLTENKIVKCGTFNQ